jgi:hypothetical protein
MKIWLLVILGVAGVLIRLLGFLPWGRGNSQESSNVRLRFLAIVGLVFLTLIFVWFWFAMKS